MVRRLFVRFNSNWAVYIFLKKIKRANYNCNDKGVWVLVTLNDHIIASWRHKAVLIELRVKIVI